MLDIKRLIAEKDEIEPKLKLREPGIDLGNIEQLDTRRRELITSVESLKAEKNSASKQIGEIIKDGGDVGAAKAAVNSLGDAIEKIDDELKDVQEQLQSIMEVLPNIPDDDTPLDLDKENNLVVRTFGHARKSEAIGSFFRDHVALGTLCDGLDFERGAKLTGSNFVIYKNSLARLEWGLISWLIDINVREFGHSLIIPPYLVNAESMFSSAQYPKFREQSYFVDTDGYALIPTGEVPLLNMFRGDKLEEEELPVQLCAFTPCFRREAGTYGRDERGLIRMHQFHKVEMFSFCLPEESSDELERMTDCAEECMRRLALPFRTTLLVSGDLATQSAKTYDIEGWIPSQGKFYEVSSCSNCTDYQARRANIRFRREESKKLEFVHTLNGSALATSRLMSALMEHYQREDGSIEIPDILWPFTGGLEEITPVR